MLDLGIVRPGTTLYIPFQTFDSNDPSASVTITGLAVTDIEIYRNGSVTQRASDTGYSLLDTDGIDFDGITGIHGFSINLASNATANFFTAGAQYWVVVSAITVDAATINFIAATFRIGYADAILNTTIATLASQTSFTLTAGPADNDALNGFSVIIHDVASAVQLCHGVVSDYVGATRTVTLAVDPGIFTMAVGDNISFFVPALQPTVAGARQVVQTGDSFARLGAPAGASVSADIATVDTVADAILVDTAEIGAAGAGLTEAGGTGDQFTAIPWNAAWDAEVQSEVDDALVARDLHYLINTALPTNWATDVTANSALDQMADDGTAAYDRTTDSLQAIADSGGGGPTALQIADAVWDEPQADHVAAGSFGVTASEIADILVDTAEIGAAGAGLSGVPWNAAWDAEVQSEVNDALVALGLDHLVSAAVIGTDVADNSIIARLVSSAATADWDTFVNTTDSLQAARDAMALASVCTEARLAELDAANIPNDLINILVDTNEIGIDGAGLSNIPWNNAVWDAQVESEVTDALNAYDPPTRAELTSDINSLNDITVADILAGTITELGAVPAASPTLAQALALLYMALRNRRDTTASSDEIHNNAGTVIGTATLSDDTVTFQKTNYT